MKSKGSRIQLFEFHVLLKVSLFSQAALNIESSYSDSFRHLLIWKISDVGLLEQERKWSRKRVRPAGTVNAKQSLGYDY